MISALIDVARRLYYNQFFSGILHTSVYCLKRELKNCETVLDLGCGNNSSLQYCRVKYSVGVENFPPYLEESRLKHIHSEYVQSDLNHINFPTKSFDAVLLLSVIEHLDKESAGILLDKAEKIAKKKVIITTPRGFLKQNVVDGNELQQHKSGWEIEEMGQRGYRAWGMSGLKILRGAENPCSNSKDFLASLTSTIRFRPKLFWALVAELSQAFVYYFPQFAFEVFYVKEITA